VSSNQPNRWVRWSQLETLSGGDCLDLVLFAALIASLDFKKIKLIWAGLKSAVEAGPCGPVFRPVRWVVIPLVILGVLTVVARLGDFDLKIEEAIYLAGGNSWDFGNRTLWWFLYEFGTIPAALVCGFALFGFVRGLHNEAFKAWRQCFLFVLLLGLIGPGVVSNLVLKEYWGRPRPREVETMGGRFAFEPVLTIDQSSTGKSFPCGHATMGYFFMGGFFLFRRYRRDWAWFFLIFGLVLGFFMGVARMCMGGHFFSDVVWAGGIIYFVALVLYYDLGLHRGLIRDPATQKTPRWMQWTIPIGGTALLIGLLLATPYRNIRDYVLLSDHAKSQPLEVHLILKRGSVSVVAGEAFSVKGEAWGHGVPTSKIGVHYVEMDRGESTTVVYKERMSGFFTEVDQILIITIPWQRVNQLIIEADDCEVKVAVPDPLLKQKIVLNPGNGAITVDPESH
jgi:lipid A 4'-phosphatase